MSDSQTAAESSVTAERPPTPEVLTTSPAPLSALSLRVRDLPRRRALLLGFLGSVVIALTSHAVGATRTRGGILQSLNMTNLGFGHIAGILVVVLWLGVLALIMSWIIIGGRIHRLGEHLGTRALVIWIAPLLLAGPLMSRDVYSYLMQGTLSREGFDPYSVGASAVPGRIFFEVSPDWRNTTTPYGPLHMWIGEGIIRITGDNVTTGIIAYKLFSVACFATLVWTVSRLAQALGVNPDTAVWLGVANPLSILHLVGGMHNEVTMMALVCAGLLAATRLSVIRGAVLGAVLIGVGISLKATAAIALPFLVWILVARHAGPLPSGAPAGGSRNGFSSADLSSDNGRADGIDDDINDINDFNDTVLRRTMGQVLRDIRYETWRRALTLVVGGVASAAVSLSTVTVVTVLSGQSWGWLSEISGNSKVINPLAVPSLVASALALPLSVINENIFFNEILAVVRPISTVVMVLVLLIAWVVWRRSVREAFIGTTVAYTATCLFNAVVLPWYYVAPLALVGLWIRNQRAFFVIVWLTMVLSLTFDGSGNNRLYNIPWLLLVGLVMWWLARTCLRSADGHGLGPAHNLPGQMSVQGIDRSSGQ